MAITIAITNYYYKCINKYYKIYIWLTKNGFIIDLGFWTDYKFKFAIYNKNLIINNIILRIKY